MAKSIHSHLFSSIINILSPKTNNTHDVGAYLMCILIFAKFGRHVGGHLGFLGPHHDSSQSPSIFLHLRYVPNHLWNNFLWTSHANRHPLRDCIILLFALSSVCEFYIIKPHVNFPYTTSIDEQLRFCPTTRCYRDDEYCHTFALEQRVIVENISHSSDAQRRCAYGSFTSGYVQQQCRT